MLLFQKIIAAFVFIYLIVSYFSTTNDGRIHSDIKTTNTSELACFAAGCFWGVENMFRTNFKLGEQLVDVRVGFANGDEAVTNPSYKRVKQGDTNFAETVLISYEPSNVTYKELAEFFFKMHDPTTMNRQGKDQGTQYRSGVFTFNDEQEKIAKTLKKTFQEEWYPNQLITTVIEPCSKFYDAEAYHQKYLQKNADGYKCPNHYLREAPSNKVAQ